jgi:hypothetical protein
MGNDFLLVLFVFVRIASGHWHAIGNTCRSRCRAHRRIVRALDEAVPGDVANARRNERRGGMKMSFREFLFFKNFSLVINF